MATWLEYTVNEYRSSRNDVRAQPARATAMRAATEHVVYQSRPGLPFALKLFFYILYLA